MIKVGDFTYKETTSDNGVTIKVVSFTISIERYDSYADFRNAIFNKLKEVPENIERIGEVKELKTVKLSPEDNFVIFFKYKELTPEQVKDKLEAERINYFVNNLG